MEFDLIRTHFEQPFEQLADAFPNRILRGIGDDCARLRPDDGQVMVVSTDLLESGVHFFEDASAFDIGWKSLAVNLSDLAACGAEPLGFVLGLGLPRVDGGWLSEFSRGLLSIAQQYDCPLVGGDTTSRRSGLGVSITVMGQHPASHQGFDRRHAQLADSVWITGLPGLARLGLLLESQSRGLPLVLPPFTHEALQDILSGLPNSLCDRARQALHKPVPRVQFSMAMRPIIHAALDLSDGLGGDLAHIASASRLGVELDEPALLDAWRLNMGDSMPDPAFVYALAISGGDDYELAFCAPETRADEIRWLGSRHCLQVTPIGRVCSSEGMYLRSLDGNVVTLSNASFDHFAS